MFGIDFHALGSSLALVAVSEMGDKTQLLSFSLATRFKKPAPILLGILVATLINHGLSAWLGGEAAQYISPRILAWVLAITFIGCGFWALLPDKLDEEQAPVSNHGAFFTTLVMFFFAEMGDKTQLATIALGARYHDLLNVTLGTTAGMMIADSLAVFAGDRLAHKVQTAWVRWIASGLFFLFGFLSLLQALATV